MKKIQFSAIAILISETIAAIPHSLKACSPGSVTPIGNFVVYDQNSGPYDTYDVFVCVSYECPSSGCQSAAIATLIPSQLGTPYAISANPISLYLPTEYQSYLYFKITIVVQKKTNGSPVGSPKSRYSYADYDSLYQTFTARTNPIGVSFP